MYKYTLNSEDGVLKTWIVRIFRYIIVRGMENSQGAGRLGQEAS